MKAARNVLFWFHLTAGCIAGLVILAMSVTGVLLAFERQINALAEAPVVLQGSRDTAPRASLDSLVDVLRNDGQGVPDRLILHNASNAPIEASYGRDRTLFLNPWTAEVVGQPSQRLRAFFAATESIHRSLGLGMRSAVGRGLTGAGNLFFLFLLFTGLYLWLPKIFNLSNLRNRVFFRGGLKGRAREWNWHHAIGIWCVVPLIFIVLTGVVMSYPWASNLLFTMTGSQPPTRGWRGEQARHRGPGNTANAHGDPAINPAYHSLNQLVAVAERRIPNWDHISIQVPDNWDSKVSVSVDTSPGGQPEEASQLVIDRRSGRVVAVRSFRDNNLGSKLRAWARFTHTGEEFGLSGQIIGALACMGAIFLAWTGMSMSVRRAAGALARSRNTTDAS